MTQRMSKNAFPFASSPLQTQTEHSGPLFHYRAAAQEGRLTFDAYQYAVVEKLERLHGALIGYRPKRNASLRWTGWLKKRRNSPPRGLYVHGQVGRGKSMVMDLFYANAPVRQRRRVHFHAFMAEIHDRLHLYRQKTKGTVSDPLLQVATEVAKQTSLLCFDEFVVNDIANAMILGRFFQALLESGVVIVATSNFAVEDLYLDGLHRERFLPFLQILRAHLDVISLDGPTDYRRDRLVGRQVYFYPLTAENCAAMEALWQESIGDRTPRPAELTVYGRRLQIPQAVTGCARFSFADLCERPLWASDYLAIAACYPTLFLDGVPELGAKNHNEARRFITLIDALYETKTRLVLTAAAAPDALYPQGKGAFEFQRTASRLIEMLSSY